MVALNCANLKEGAPGHTDQPTNLPRSPGASKLFQYFFKTNRPPIKLWINCISIEYNTDKYIYPVPIYYSGVVFKEKEGVMEKYECGPRGGSKTTKDSKNKTVTSKQMMKQVDPNKMEMRTAAPLFVQATRDGLLASKLWVEEEKLSCMVGWRFKIVERGGKTLRDGERA